VLPEWFEAATAGTECGALVRAVDWSATSLGDPDGWPSALRSAVELCLSTRFPVLVTWGDDLVMLYNDGYRESLGSLKHPVAMGRPVKEIWPEIWDEIEPLFLEVMHTGRPTWAVDRPLLIDRDGFAEQVWFTFSYSVLRDESGVARGVIDIATETTTSVVDRRRLGRLSILSARLQAVSGDVGAVGRVSVDELAAAREDVAAADVHLLDGDDLVLLASTRRAGRSVVDPRTLRDVVAGGVPVDVDSCRVVPLRSGRDAPVGVLVLEPAPLRPYDPGYRAFFDLLAGAVGTAVAAAVRQEREVGDLRRVSRALQMSMLPAVTGVPHVASRYVAAVGNLAVGGDWYDVVPLGGGRTAFVVGDCVGHDLTAATVMGQLRSASRALLLQQRGAAATLEALDRFAHELPGAECATVFCGVLDAEAGTITYASAGHPPPLALDEDGCPRWLQGARSVPLAVVPGQHRREVTEPLDGSGTVVLYTDGLVERRGESLDVGLRRLERAAAEAAAGAEGATADDFADALLRRMLPHGARDDVALLVRRPVRVGAMV
jgi:hypothetical protein